MVFSQKPSESKAKLNRAGEILVKDNPGPTELEAARELAERWRACHAYPINTFQATLRTRLKNLHDSGEAIVAQRLKRMPTIIDKLKRYPNMQLSRMQDIGGVRAILNRLSDVYDLANTYKSSTNFSHELVGQHDYIMNPRNEDGYRSVHLIYKYKNARNPAYDGLRLEMQLRTKLQHTWATAVETMGTFLGQALKSRQGDQEWLDFFALVSSAFAHKEGTSAVPRFEGMNAKETFAAVARAEKRLGALRTMRGVSLAVEHIGNAPSLRGKYSYHLIVLNSLEKTVEISAFDRDSLEQAVKEYSNREKEAADGKQIEPVLVSAGPIATLRRAYPNFFLDINDFVTIVEGIVKQ